MKIIEIFLLVHVFVVGFIVSADCRTIYGSEYFQQNSYSLFNNNYNDTNRVFFSATDSSKTSSLNFDLGSAHKVLGYTTILTAFTAGVSGVMVANAYERDRQPSSRLKSVHKASSVGTLGLAIGSCTTGILAYFDMLNFKDGVNAYNTHAVTAVLSTLGFVIATAMAPESEDGGTLKKRNYSKHCTLAEASGVTMFASVIVIHF